MQGLAALLNLKPRIYSIDTATGKAGRKYCMGISDNQVLGDIDKAHKFGGKPRIFPERTLGKSLKTL